MIFNLGDEELPSYANDLVHAFGCALRYLRTEITIGSLHIGLAYHAFSHSAQLSGFASALSKIKVQNRLIILGDEKFLEMSFGDLATNLGMNVMPMYSHFQAYNPSVQHSPGWFHHEYVPNKHADKDAEPQHEHLVVNSTSTSEAGKAFGA